MNFYWGRLAEETTTMTPRNASVALIGAGDFIGSAIAERFAAEGYLIYAGRRTADKLETLESQDQRPPEAAARRAGWTPGSEEDITAFIEEADAAAPLEVCIFNPGANVNFHPFGNPRHYRAGGSAMVWELACYGGFLTGREAARKMLPRGAGSIFFTGATASLRGGVGYAAFASAKFGLRAVAQLDGAGAGWAAGDPRRPPDYFIDAGVDTAFVRDRIKARAAAKRRWRTSSRTS